MTKNIIGLPIVGSLCYISVGLVKSIVWMSAIREMDVCDEWTAIQCTKNDTSLP
ncbi:membrane protein [Sinorhizobium meliloti]|nr:hypothetical protein C770_GR4pC1016 [Sinorhizobium meliloti GR4]KKA08047.1 membrane protein [Sinorhizobium meliloti]CCM70542.1 putative membrane protein [Sinorhizobium meliloti Rm41]